MQNSEAIPSEAIPSEAITSAAIRATRDRLGETQSAFGQRFGVDQSTVHRWETEGVPSRGAARVAIERVLSDLSAAS